MTTATRTLPVIENERLVAVVRSALDAPSATIAGGWGWQPLAGGWGDGVGIWRLDGEAWVGSARRSWSLVLKSLPGGAGAPTWDDPHREADVYRSGVLAALPGGLAAPRCYDVEDRPDGTTWLWLEAIDDDMAPWPERQYAAAAEALGRFNGAYLSGRPLPVGRWVSRSWMSHYVEPSGPLVTDLSRIAGDGANPLMRALFPPARVAAYARLWDERDRIYTALDRLPQTFCHFDAYRSNLLGRPGAAEGTWPVLVDWAFAGIGAVGEDLVPLVLMAAERDGSIDLRRLDTACFAAYLRGLRAAGWNGDARLARLGFTAAGALRYAIGRLRLTVPMTMDPALRSRVEQMMGLSIAEVVAAMNALCVFEDELAAEARSLLPLIA